MAEQENEFAPGAELGDAQHGDSSQSLAMFEFPNRVNFRNPSNTIKDLEGNEINRGAKFFYRDQAKMVGEVAYGLYLGDDNKERWIKVNDADRWAEKTYGFRPAKE